MGPDTEQYGFNIPLIVQPKLNDGLDAVRNQLNIQAQNGNWNYDPYMHGMYNGLACALATLEGREPEYKSAPDEWICDKVYDGLPMETTSSV